MKQNKKYKKTLPRLLYTFFTSYSEPVGAPSFQKFARSCGVTLAELESFRKNREFDRAWRECSEIRRDYLTDNALTKRFDPSFVKFLLMAEYGVGEKDETGGDGSLTVTLEVVGEDKNES